MIDAALMNEIREAAAQGKTSLHEEKVCMTCGGPTFSSDGSIKLCCQDCNRNGKENAK